MNCVPIEEGTPFLKGTPFDPLYLEFHIEDKMNDIEGFYSGVLVFF